MISIETFQELAGAALKLLSGRYQVICCRIAKRHMIKLLQLQSFIISRSAR